MADRARPRVRVRVQHHPPVPADREQLEEAVRDFLAQVDPDTGHIE
ncbi:hypothetical protein AB0O75_09705 [Streptomyces sp. NPDC088921]